MVIAGGRWFHFYRRDIAAPKQSLGLLAALWRYRQEEGRKLDLDAHAPFARSAIPPASSASPQQRPDLVMLQCESFFDVRRAYQSVRPDVLATFDALRAEAISHGHLQVPAWGANTVRTEYAVLSGVDPALMGVHRYNPYRRLSLHAVTTMARHLQGQGYKTICVHPYAVSFYRRHHSFPAMGFDVFLEAKKMSNSFSGKPCLPDAMI